MVCRIYILAEKDDNRVSLDPENAKKFIGLGAEVKVQKKSGEKSFFSDDAYTESGATLVNDSAELEGDIICSINLPQLSILEKLKDITLVTFLQPHKNKAEVELLQKNNICVIALEFIPRITRAQSMDVLSSQASAAGYKAALNAATHYRGFFPMLTTAAGTIRPAKVIVVGAGVAGLQAIATCKRLGAIVEAYDIRPDAKEQIESLGAKMIDTGVSAAGAGGYARELTEEEKASQTEILANHVKKANILITTAAIPGRKSPQIISDNMVKSMKAGSVIVDMAAEGGGNCANTVAGEVIDFNGITIDGTLAIPSYMAIDASKMFAKNIFNLLSPFIKDGEFSLDMEDDVLKGCVVLKDGNVCNDLIK